LSHSQQRPIFTPASTFIISQTENILIINMTTDSIKNGSSAQALHKSVASGALHVSKLFDVAGWVAVGELGR
jgi:hypothetical protein